MLPIIGWKVYCADGTVHTDNPGAIQPNVQVVIYYHEAPYRTLSYGEDFYELDGHTLIGSWQSDQDYYAMLDKALKDLEIP